MAASVGHLNIVALLLLLGFVLGVKDMIRKDRINKSAGHQEKHRTSETMEVVITDVSEHLIRREHVNEGATTSHEGNHVSEGMQVALDSNAMVFLADDTFRDNSDNQVTDARANSSHADQSLAVDHIATKDEAVPKAYAKAPQTTTISKGEGNFRKCDWSKPTNWDSGVPSGSMNAVVASGIRVIVDGFREFPPPTIPIFSGSLTLLQWAYLSLQRSAHVVVGASDIIMKEGSTIMSNFSGTINYPPIKLEGNAAFVYSSRGTTTSFKTINGAHILTIEGANGIHINFNAANTFSSLILTAADQYRVYATAPSSLGSGDVTISGREVDGRSAQLCLIVSDTIDDSATLTLNGKGFDPYTKDRIEIAHGVEETIGALIIDDVKQPSGTYNKNNAAWLFGDGVLIVRKPPLSYICCWLPGSITEMFGCMC